MYFVDIYNGNRDLKANLCLFPLPFTYKKPKDMRYGPNLRTLTCKEIMSKAHSPAPSLSKRVSIGSYALMHPTLSHPPACRHVFAWPFLFLSRGRQDNTNGGRLPWKASFLSSSRWQMAWAASWAWDAQKLAFSIGQTSFSLLLCHWHCCLPLFATEAVYFEIWI